MVDYALRLMLFFYDDKRAALAWDDLPDDWSCPVCGNTVEGGKPDKCDVCGIPGERFIEIS